MKNNNKQCESVNINIENRRNVGKLCNVLIKKSEVGHIINVNIKLNKCNRYKIPDESNYRNRIPCLLIRMKTEDSCQCYSPIK